MPLASSTHGGGYSGVIELEEFVQQEPEAQGIELHARYQELQTGHFLCIECYTMIKRKQDMVRHLEKTAKHGERHYPCTKCEKLYTRSETLRAHKCKGKKL